MSFQHPIVIIKADDFGQQRNFENWKRFIFLCAKYKLRPTVGVVAQPLETYPADILQLMAGLHASGTIELWNHSFAHTNFMAMSEDAIREDIRLSQDAIETYLLTRPKAFGFPFNKFNAEAVAVIDSMKEFDTFFFTGGMGSDTFAIDRSSLMEIELSTQSRYPIGFDYFLKRYTLVKQKSNVFTLQAHPPYWSNHCFEVFETILQYLRKAGTLGMTIGQYRDYARLSDPTTAGSVETLGRGALARIDEVSHALMTEAMAAVEKPDPKWSYHLNRIKSGATLVWETLIDLGFEVSPNIKDDYAMLGLELGSGTGQWTWAYANLPGMHKALGIDIDPDMKSHCDRVIEQLPGCTGNVEFRTGDIRKLTSVYNETVDHLIYNNTFNYVAHEDVFAEIYRVLGFSRFAFIGVQRRSFIFAEIATMARTSNDAGLIRRTSQLYTFEALRDGVFIPGGFSHYESDDDIWRCLELSGMRGVVRDFEYEPRGEIFEGESVYGGYLAIKTSAAERMARQHYDSPDFSQASLDELWHIGLRKRFAEQVMKSDVLAQNPFNLWRSIIAVMQDKGLTDIAAVWDAWKAATSIPAELLACLSDAAETMLSGDTAGLVAIFAEAPVFLDGDMAKVGKIAALYVALKAGAADVDVEGLTTGLSQRFLQSLNFYRLALAGDFAGTTEAIAASASDLHD